jgi:hypothetical protein
MAVVWSRLANAQKPKTTIPAAAIRRSNGTNTREARSNAMKRTERNVASTDLADIFIKVRVLLMAAPISL